MKNSKILTVALYTFKEIFKSKILLNVFFVGLGMMLVTYVATEFTYGVPQRVALDFGLGMLSISSLGISLFLGVGLLSKEIDSRTVYMVISRPVPRYAFILGKVLGLMTIQFINVLILSVMTFISTYLLGGYPGSLFYWAIGFTYLESFLLLLLVLFISLIANNILTVICSIIFLLLGHSITETKEISFVKGSVLLTKLLDVYHFFLPAFHKLNLKNYILYEKSLPGNYLFIATTYGLTYSLALLSLIIFIFNRKNLD